jgi:hypothetical protein
MEQHRTEDTEVTAGKLGVVDERAWVNTADFRARTREWKGIAQRTQRAQRGKLGGVDERAWGNTVGIRARTRE